MIDDHDHDHEWATLDCPTCEGEGVIQWNPSPTGDPACVEDDVCPDCRGSGVAETCERSAA